MNRTVFIFLICIGVNFQVNAQTAEQFFKTGIIKYKIGDYAGAVESFSQAIKLNPNYEKAYNNRGIAKAKMGDYEASILDFDKVISLNPYKSSAYRNRGVSKEKLKDFNGAYADFVKLNELLPGNAYARKKVANLKPQVTTIKETNKPEGKVVEIDDAYLQTAPQPQSEVQVSNKVERDQESTSSLQKVVIISEKKAEDLIAFGEKKEKEQDFKAAFSAYNQAINQNPTNAVAYNARGRIKSIFRNYVAEIDINESSKSYQEKFDDAYESTELLKGDFGAIDDYTKAISIDSAYAEAYFNRAMSLYNLKEYALAIIDFNKAISVDNKLAKAFYYRGIVKGVLNEIGGACLDFIAAHKLGYAEAADLIEDCQ